jgi:hypothetical protein
MEARSEPRDRASKNAPAGCGAALRPIELKVHDDSWKQPVRLSTSAPPADTLITDTS